MTSLCNLAREFVTDKGPPSLSYPLAHNYTPHYDRHLRGLRQKPITLLEIGVLHGSSLRMWEAWMPKATIIGVDINPPGPVNTKRVTTVVCDIKEYEPQHSYDVVIDDGSHVSDDIVAAFALLWPSVVLGGWYIIEDLQVHPFDAGVVKMLNHFAEMLGCGEGALSELHRYPEIAFLRKAGGS